MSQKFTLKERDNETGLDYFLARYYSSTQGRFASPDAPFEDQVADEPQSLNLYSYVVNNPLRYIDPFGLWRKTPEGFIAWENSDDTWESLGKLLGATPPVSSNFLSGGSVRRRCRFRFCKFQRKSR
ncbi:MAG: RHS repeat-associated core domain-containing protein [Pyrinomonadaceae bacterium]